MLMAIFSRVSVLLTVLLLLTACAGLETDPTKDWTAERFYTEGKTELKQSNYETAIKHFETLEARYPYGPYAEQAQLEVAYAYYLKGLANFDDQPNFLERFFTGQNLSDRDPRGMREAYDAFRELVEHFPRSRYAEDSRNRMAHLVNFLAKNEINVARFYYSRGAYVATVNRAKYVIERYQRTPSVEDALGLQAMAYKKMGMEGLMADTVRVLEKNFPGSHYLKELNT